MNIDYFQNKIALLKMVLENAKTDEQREKANKDLRKLDGEFLRAWQEYSDKLEKERAEINKKASQIEDEIHALKGQFKTK